MILGEQFDIRSIKWAHLTAFVLMLLAMAGVSWSLEQFLSTRFAEGRPGLWAGQNEAISWSFAGFLLPMICGLIIGPWLDIQQWQRAIQIHKEKGSIQLSYLFGGLTFCGILLFHGLTALTVFPAGGEQIYRSLPATLDKLFHAKSTMALFFFDTELALGTVGRVSYFVFIMLAIITTLDSGYIALKWYLAELTRKSEHIIFTIIPEGLLKSPVPIMLLAVITAAVSVPLGFQLEYFMSFYAAFGVGYAVVFLFRTTYKPQFTNFTQSTLFGVAAFSLGLFGIGYFMQYWLCMALGALIPMVHGLVVISSRVVVDDLQKALPQHESTDAIPLESVTGKAAANAVHALEAAISRLDPKVAKSFNNVIHKIEPTAAQALATVLAAIQPQMVASSDATAVPAQQVDTNAEIEHARGHFEGKWFTYTFMATYQDTNSVGNVYFAMYALWVGKVREMFFQACMPDFDLKKTHFYILTRSFEHKFNNESKEFEFITVRIRVESFNRKFATLEHEVYNHAKVLLGKGKQVLLFVNSADYRIIDLPNEVKTAFLPHI
ncbi:MAG TPA: acyl-CoA thioesterase, partial [Salinarimonas sp.]|nr:acyl-CoA thioesterase [Salinarimonas sp.]